MKHAIENIGDLEIEYLTKFDCDFYNSKEEWKAAEGNDAPEEVVRF
jgi:hypothetical protein